MTLRLLWQAAPMLDERYLSQLPALRSRLVRTAARLLGTHAEAEDVVQDTYLRALEAGDAAPPASTQAWLTTVVRHLAIDRLRREDWMRRWLHDAGDVHAPEASSAEADAAQAESVERALRLLASKLSPADGAALLLHEVFEASFKEIAQASGKTEAACRQQVHRALLRLRQDRHADDEHERAASPAHFQVYRQALLQCDAAPLRALLRTPPTRAFSASASATPASTPHTVCQLVHLGGQLGLVLTLGDKVLCVLPLEATQPEEVAQ
ncbi:sigma-70 family RNA polymerase sigma factor [Variovorax boronicumulans]|uniref:sigma-70 family RNA polymerase sigma factor n=1 Tax=Variovorax boronicumulans TaxID=436515 RepID=UPI00280C14C9|nr:sigma-70 family RNA polymerase sigma factor [Variovorax boronicumulans]